MNTPRVESKNSSPSKKCANDSLNYIAVKSNESGNIRERSILLSPPKRSSNIGPVRRRNMPLPEGPPPDLVLEKMDVKPDTLDDFNASPLKGLKHSDHISNNQSISNQQKDAISQKAFSRSMPGLKGSFERKPPPTNDDLSKKDTASYELEEYSHVENVVQIQDAIIPPTFSSNNRQEVDHNRRESLQAWGSSRELISRELDNKVDFSECLKNPGRLSIWIRSIHFDCSDDVFTKTFLRLSLKGTNNKVLRKQSKLIDSYMKGSSVPLNQVLQFDIAYPCDFVVSGCIVMTFHVVEVSLVDEEVVGETEISIARFLSSKEMWNEIVVVESKKNNLVASIDIETNFRTTTRGMLLISMEKVSGVIGGAISQVSIRINDETRSTNVVSLNSDEGNFNDEKLYFPIDETNWFSSASIDLSSSSTCNEDELGVFASSTIDIFSYVCNELESSRSITVTIQDSHNESGIAHLSFSLTFFKAGLLEIQIIEAKHLRGDKRLPYAIRISSESAASKFSASTTPVLCSEGRVEWNQTISMYPVDHHQLMIHCLQSRSRGDDTREEIDSIGSYDLSLLPVYKNGRTQTWLDLRFINNYGTSIDGGKIQISMIFHGEDGIRFPQNRPEIASFDEKDRRYSDSLAVIDTSWEPNEPNSDNRKLEENIELDMEFSDEDIKEAFQFLDLDKNGYIGIAELRQILKCMGISVADKVLDMMIKMLDINGDGQVSLTEFHSMVRSKDPTNDNFSRESLIIRSHLPVLTPNKRLEDIKVRDVKRKHLSRLVNIYSIGKLDVCQAWTTIERGYDRQSNKITFEMFCSLFSLDATGEVRALFKLFDKESVGKIDAREIILAITNFIPHDKMARDEKCSLIFDMFDEDKSGSLTLTELQDILAANHMLSRESVEGKARTIFKTIDEDGSGDISLQELISVSARFPNILLPRHE